MTAESGAQIRILPKDKRGFTEKLIADINTAATNNGYDDSILKPFQEAKGVCTKKNTKLAASSVSTDVSSSHDDVGPKLAKELSNKDG
ncbi:ABC transporter B family member 1 isoform G [Glycine soja]|uniref:ABC transporter B family member 1 isoform G n=1 Tax=Glycine soja TaxID=3848 RepID=A0A445JU02_GLYSO|nr:ABC transporter B family member 1 isoform G [Glycine soja]